MKPTYELIQGDVLEKLKELPDGIIQCVITSPPYWKKRDYGIDGQLGNEDNPDCLGWATGHPCGECYVCHLVAVFDEVWRVLRLDGTVWLNLGDSYWAGGSTTKYSQDARNFQGSTLATAPTSGQCERPVKPRKHAFFKQKDLMMLPQRVAMALQMHGWYLRSNVIWAKKDGMPDSTPDRPGRRHEDIFMLTKQPRYYFDMEAVRTPLKKSSKVRLAEKTFHRQAGGAKDPKNGGEGTSNRSARKALENVKESADAGQGANIRDVWRLTTARYKGSHFATFPTTIPERCIKASTSEKGQCPSCGKPWRRIIKKDASGPVRQGNAGLGDAEARKPFGEDRAVRRSDWQEGVIRRTISWQPSCDCGAGDPVPQIVLDPFAGTDTTGAAANGLGRSSIGIELNPEYIALAHQRHVDTGELQIKRKKIRHQKHIEQYGLPTEEAVLETGIIQTTFLVEDDDV